LRTYAQKQLDGTDTLNHDERPTAIRIGHMPKLSVLLTPSESDRLDAYCRKSGHKKSPLVAKLVKDHLETVGIDQPAADAGSKPTKPSRNRRSQL
jgi:hypothetical protein